MEMSDAEAIQVLQDHGIEVFSEDERTLVKIATDMGLVAMTTDETIVISPVAE